MDPAAGRAPSGPVQGQLPVALALGLAGNLDAVGVVDDAIEEFANHGGEVTLPVRSLVVDDATGIGLAEVRRRAQPMLAATRNNTPSSSNEALFETIAEEAFRPLYRPQATPRFSVVRATMEEAAAYSCQFCSDIR